MNVEEKSRLTRKVDQKDAQPIETLYLSAITVAELRFGLARTGGVTGHGLGGKMRKLVL